MVIGNRSDVLLPLLIGVGTAGKYSTAALPVQGRSAISAGSPALRAPIPSAQGGNIPSHLPPGWDVLLSAQPTPEFKAVEVAVDRKLRGLSAELFAAARNGADSARAQKTTEMLHLAVGFLKDGVSASEVMDLVEEGRQTRRRQVAESSAMAEARQRSAEVSADDGEIADKDVGESRSTMDVDKDKDEGPGKDKEANSML